MNFDYNTQRKKMALPEYGRNVQNMVDFVKTIEDKEERSRAAASVIMVMANLNTSHFRDDTEFKHTLWDHLAIIADYDIDIDSPYPLPQRQSSSKPNSVPYNQGELSFLHYGRIIEDMIKAVVDMEDGEEKRYWIGLIINQMKKTYVAWNRSHIDNDVVCADFVKLSGGKLSVPEGIKMMSDAELNHIAKQNTQFVKGNKQYIGKKKSFSNNKH